MAAGYLALIVFADAAAVNCVNWPACTDLTFLETWYLEPPSNGFPNTHFRHQGLANVGFLDGHVESHQWRDERTRYPNKYCGCLSHYAADGLYTQTSNNVDIAWLQERATRPKD